MSKTVVGLFSTIAEAEKVKQTLLDDGYESRDVKVVAKDDTSGSSLDSTSSTLDTTRSTMDTEDEGEGIGDKISRFFRSLTGGDETIHDHYASGVNQGGALVAVTVEDAEADEVAAALRQHGAREIEGDNLTGTGSPAYRENTAGVTGSPAYRENTADVTGENTIPVIEEELNVGKRAVERGGVRVYSHMTERPAEAEVTLREENVNVERRPVNRPATAADFQAGSGGPIEVKATSEEAVIGKQARVVEEVFVGKKSSERTEAIRDTVRKTEVEVENLEGTINPKSTGTNDRY